MSGGPPFGRRHARENTRLTARLLTRCASRPSSLLAFAASVVLAAGGASAQFSAQATPGVELETSPGPHYTGEAIELRVVATGFDRQPEIQVAQPSSGQLVPIGVDPSSSTSIVIVNGQIRRTQEVSFTFRFRFTGEEPGRVTVGPFRLEHGGESFTTNRAELELLPVPTSDRLAIELVLPDTPVYVGERVPVKVRFRLEADLRDKLHRYALRVPLFDLSDTFQFLDPPPPENGTDIEIQTANGVLPLRGLAVQNDDGLLVEVERIAVPLRAGALEIPPSALDAEEGIRFRRDFFGGRQATRVRKWRAVDEPRHLVVKQIPTAGMPESFAGAVGSGFTLNVTADRTVVQVGDPISLSIELKGDGNLETAGLPPLDAEGLLSPSHFRVPSGDLTGQLEDGTKRFSAVVRVLDVQATEVPALEYAWFDPKTEQFEVTRSRPIALSVRDAEVIGAGDVLRPDRAAADVTGPRPDVGDAAATADRARGPLALTGADLAIEREPSRLLRHVGTAAASGWLVAGLYAGSGLLVLGAQLDRRRRSVDPAIAQQRRRVDAALRTIREAAGLPAAEAAAELGRGLRRLRAELPNRTASGIEAEIDAFIGECDARSYAPEVRGDAAASDPAFAKRALELAQRFSAVER